MTSQSISGGAGREARCCSGAGRLRPPDTAARDSSRKDPPLAELHCAPPGRCHIMSCLVLRLEGRWVRSDRGTPSIDGQRRCAAVAGAVSGLASPVAGRAEAQKAAAHVVGQLDQAARGHVDGHPGAAARGDRGRRSSSSGAARGVSLATTGFAWPWSRSLEGDAPGCRAQELARARFLELPVSSEG